VTQACVITNNDTYSDNKNLKYLRPDEDEFKFGGLACTQCPEGYRKSWPMVQFRKLTVGRLVFKDVDDHNKDWHPTESSGSERGLISSLQLPSKRKIRKNVGGKRSGGNKCLCLIPVEFHANFPTSSNYGVTCVIWRQFHT